MFTRENGDFTSAFRRRRNRRWGNKKARHNRAFSQETSTPSVFCEDKTIEMFLRFRCLDLNTRHNHSTSLRFCFQGCLQRHLDFRAADKDHLDFLF